MEKAITVLPLFLCGREADRSCYNGLMVLETPFSVSLFGSRCSYLLGFLLLFYFILAQQKSIVLKWVHHSVK